MSGINGNDALIADTLLFPNLDPELIDSGFMAAKHALPVLSTDPLMAAWKDELMQVIIALLDAKGVAWTSINVVRMGCSDEWQGYPVCILISTSVEEEEQQREGSQELQQHILAVSLHSLGSQWKAASTDPSASGQYMCVNVTFVQSKASCYQEHKPELKHITPGGTISCGGAFHGIMGGFIKVTKVDGESDVYGLTCHHVVAHGAEAVDMIDDMIVNHPSDRSHQNDCDRVNLDLQRLQKSTVSDPADSQRVLEKRRLNLQEMDRACGRVFRSSGLQRTTDIGGSMDWALIKLNDHCFCSNKVKDSIGTISLTDTTSIATHTHPHSHHTPPSYDATSCVLKVGTSHNQHRQYGCLNGIKSATRLDYRKNVVKSVTPEWVIVGRDPVEAFAKRGDSGTWVMMQADAKVVGLVIGGLLRLPFLTFVTDINEIMEDVERDQNARCCKLVT